MAFIRFTNFDLLNDAEVRAKEELQEALDNPVERTANVRNARQDLAEVTSLLDLYEFGGQGEIYLDSGDVSLIKRFAE